MRVERVFHPVGQGAFYTERLYEILIDGEYYETYNIIYDCGSTEGIQLVKDRIISCFNRRETIHNLYISHFHEDHIKGVKYLLERRNVRKLTLPYLTPNEKFISLCSFISSIQGNDLKSDELASFNFFTGLIIDPITTISDYQLDTEVVLISPSEGKESREEEIGDEFNEIFQRIQEREVSHRIAQKHSKICKSTSNQWNFEVYHVAASQNTLLLLKEINKRPELKKKIINLITDRINQKKVSFDHVLKKELRQLYKTLSHGVDELNTNSLILYSGPSALGGYSVIFNRRDCFGLYGDDSSMLEFHLRPGCIYTGDYNMKDLEMWEQFHAFYNKYQDSIGVLQIPHHGSALSYHPGLARKDKIYIISAGVNNRYRHPHVEVLKSLDDRGCTWFVVNQFIRSTVRCEIIKN